MVQKIIGIDLGGTTLKLAILDLLGIIEKQWSISIDTREVGIAIVPDIIESLREHFEKRGDCSTGC